MDRSSQLVVAEDLLFLSEWGGTISQPEIRRGSATLRRLLIEGTYSAAWRAAGFSKEPSVVAVDLRAQLKPFPIEVVALALALGGEVQGLGTATLIATKVTPGLPESSEHPESPGSTPIRSTFGLSRYLQSPSAYAFGEWISRADVIKYIANVKGGVHLSEAQRRRESELVNRVGRADQKLNVQGTEGLLLELVSIAQDVGRSTDARAYRNAGG